ncbi:HAD family phosphatase [Candidatus Micrarchaeota archaeon]|nr:HAD family phosphatase [Candidatus Micrarchaeota archaeon]
MIFDMDGVISDSEEMHLKAEEIVLKEIGIELSFDEMKDYAGVVVKDFFKEMLEKYKVKGVTPEELLEKKDEFFFPMLEEVKPIKGSIELLKELKGKGMKTALATSSRKKVADFILKKFNLEKEFNAVVNGEDVIHSKPHPEPFLLAAKKMKVNPEECLVIEDSEKGVIGAKKAGMKCIGLKDEKSGRQDLSKADLVTGDLRKLSHEKIKQLF